MTAAVSVIGVKKSYGARSVLKGVSLDLAPGERLALLGPNGAGKTTLIKLMLGLTWPDGGEIRVLGGLPGTPRGWNALTSRKTSPSTSH